MNTTAPGIQRVEHNNQHVKTSILSRHHLYFDGTDTSTALKRIRTFQILILNPYGAGIDFSRQNLTSVDVRF